MDRERLKGYLEQGLSLERIAELVDKHPSTVGYWLKQHGLTPNGSKYGNRLEVDDELVRALADEGLTVGEMAERLGASPSTVTRRLKKLGITRRSSSRRAQALAAREQGETRFISECRRHGTGEFLAFPGGRSRCAKCNAEGVTRWRRRLKQLLVEEAGGRCMLCGYEECAAALQFHHLDPSEKKHGIGEVGATRSLARAREEAAKCVLLCANCHAAVEIGFKKLPLELGLIATSE